MAMTSKRFLVEIREIFILVVVGFAMTFLLNYNRTPRQYLIIGAFAALMWVFLWKGNYLLSEIVWRKIDWLKSPLRTFLVGFVATVLLTVGIVFLLVKAFEYAFDFDFGNISSMIYSTVTFTLMITFFMNGRAFLIRWRDTALDAEQLKRESITAQYESLKNQVNPHFLFNSLNALTNLVYEDQDKAARFIKQLSEVYRYVLDSRGQEVAPLEDELRFLDSYLFLQGIRFGDKLKVRVDLPNRQWQVVPLVLQMLVENAIKHNEISQDLPLEIRIYAENGWIVVENNIQRKSLLPGESPGVGLDNIQKRYRFASDKEVRVEEDGKRFVVKLPAIEGKAL